MAGSVTVAIDAVTSTLSGFPDEATTTAVGDAATEGVPATTRLANTLINTFGAIIFGLACVKFSVVCPARGDTRAMGFYTGQVALPLLIFKTVVTAELGSVDLGTLAACTAGKACVAIITWILTYFIYSRKHSQSEGQRIIQSTIFAFFVIASNDFALGFPVIDALYGTTDPSMPVYIAGNALVGALLFMPVVLVLIEVGRNMRDKETTDTSLDSGGETPSSSGTMWGKLLGDILLNPVITCTLIGIAYKFVNWMVTGSVGKVQLPAIMVDALTLFTGPFAMCALFLTGTTLQTWKANFTSLGLVVMKVVVCAYGSYFFARLFVSSSLPNKLTLKNFAFFYGAIPTSSTPLVLASQSDPGSAELMATAVLIGLFMAAPMMFITAIFLMDETKDMAVTLAGVQLSLHLFSFVCSLLFIFVLIAMGRKWGYFCPGKQLTVWYGVVLTLYTALMAQANPLHNPSYCENYGAANGWTYWSVGVTYLQNVARFVIICMQQFLVCDDNPDHTLWDGLARLVMCLVAAVLPALFASPNTVNEICDIHLNTLPLVINCLWSSLCLAVAASLGLMQMRSTITAAGGDSEEEDEEEEEEEVEESDAEGSDRPSSSRTRSVALDDSRTQWLCHKPKRLARVLATALVLRLFMQVVNVSQVLLDVTTRGSFAAMLVAEALLEHTQLLVLLLALLTDRTFSAHLMTVLPDVWLSWKCLKSIRSGEVMPPSPSSLNYPVRVWRRFKRNEPS